MLSSHARQKIETYLGTIPRSLRPPLATENQLSEFEANYGPVPKDYRWFLSHCGGGAFGDEHLDDILTLPRTHEKLRDEGPPSKGCPLHDVFVIGWNAGENPFGIERSSGRVLLVDRTLHTVQELAPSLEEFILRRLWAGATTVAI